MARRSSADGTAVSKLRVREQKADVSEFAKLMRDRRVSHGLDQKQFQGELKLTLRDIISHIETGTRPDPGEQAVRAFHAWLVAKGEAGDYTYERLRAMSIRQRRFAVGCGFSTWSTPLVLAAYQGKLADFDVFAASRKSPGTEEMTPVAVTAKSVGVADAPETQYASAATALAWLEEGRVSLAAVPSHLVRNAGNFGGETSIVELATWLETPVIASVLLNRDVFRKSLNVTNLQGTLYGDRDEFFNKSGRHQSDKGFLNRNFFIEGEPRPATRSLGSVREDIQYDVPTITTARLADLLAILEAAGRPCVVAAERDTVAEHFAEDVCEAAGRRLHVEHANAPHGRTPKLFADFTTASLATSDLAGLEADVRREWSNDYALQAVLAWEPQTSWALKRASVRDGWEKLALVHTPDARPSQSLSFSLVAMSNKFEYDADAAAAVLRLLERLDETSRLLNIAFSEARHNLAPVDRKKCNAVREDVSRLFDLDQKADASLRGMVFQVRLLTSMFRQLRLTPRIGPSKG